MPYRFVRPLRRTDCPRCEGGGEISPNPRDPMSPWYPCPDCDGTGDILEPEPTSAQYPPAHDLPF